MKAKQFILMLLVMLGSVTGAWAETVSYIDVDGTSKSVDATVITNSSRTLDAGWYVVKETINTGSLSCNGNVNIILKDDAWLTATGGKYEPGIRVTGNSSLTIYGQTAQTGQLTATGGQFGAGIGGGLTQAGCNITINGGMITANGGENGAGIGGGFGFMQDSRDGYNITINGGVVNANGGYRGAGIGGASTGRGYNIKINGGAIKANAGSSASCIGRGWEGDSSHDIYVKENILMWTNDNLISHSTDEDVSDKLLNKGNVTICIPKSLTITLDKQGGTDGSDRITADVWKEMPKISVPKRDNFIFKGYYSGMLGKGTKYYNADGTSARICNMVENTTLYAHWAVQYVDTDGTTKVIDSYNVISNTTTTLNAGWHVVFSPDVATGTLNCNGDVHLILVDNHKLTATGNDFCSGISSGEGSSLTIYGQSGQTGQLIANGGYEGAGIGGGERGSGNNITINGGVITANGGSDAAGIGGGKYGSGNNITINGGVITANGSFLSAGIGGGENGSGNNITINGGMITANGGEYGAGIGGGENGSGNNITINGGMITANGGRYGAGIGSGQDGSSSQIYVKSSLKLIAGDGNPPTTLIEHETGEDVSEKLGARYAIVEAPSYTVTFDKQGGSGGPDEVIARESFVMPRVEVPTKEPFSFQGYYASPNGVGTKYYNADGTSAHVWDRAEAVLYAYWIHPDHNYDATDITDDTRAYTCSTCGYVNEALKTQFDARDYLSMKAVDGDVTIGFKNQGIPDSYTIQWSSDRIHWSEPQTLEASTSATTIPIVMIPEGQTYYFRHGSAEATKHISSGDGKYWSFTMDGAGTVEAGGNIMSLLDATCQQTELPMMPQHVFTKLFYNCEKLTVAPRMDAITAVPQWGFVSMFAGSGITAAPALSATYIRDGAYSSMFENCKELVSVPALPATNLKRCAYRNMFKGCDKLTSIEIANIESMEADEGSTGSKNSFHDMLVGTAVGTTGVMYMPDAMVGSNDIHLPENWTMESIDGHHFVPETDEEGNDNWVWEGLTKATLKFVCTKNANHKLEMVATGNDITNAITTARTCTVDGIRTYTATVIVDGVEYKSTKDIVEPMFGHDYQYGVCTRCGDSPSHFDAFTITDGDPYIITHTCEVGSLTYSRYYPENIWSAWFTPFDVNASHLKANGLTPAYIEGIHNYDDNEDGTIDRTVMEIVKISNGRLRAGTPLLVRAAEGYSEQLVLSNVTMKASDDQNNIHTETATSIFDFIGTYAGTTAAAADNIYSLNNSGAMVHRTGTILPLRWYCQIEQKPSFIGEETPAPAFARAIYIRVIGEEDQVTGIRTLYDEANQTLERADGIFDLSGRKLSVPQHGKINIINGKKQFVK